jgi:hypothetical protein
LHRGVPSRLIGWCVTCTACSRMRSMRGTMTMQMTQRRSGSTCGGR